MQNLLVRSEVDEFFTICLVMFCGIEYCTAIHYTCKFYALVTIKMAY